MVAAEKAAADKAAADKAAAEKATAPKVSFSGPSAEPVVRAAPPSAEEAIASMAELERLEGRVEVLEAATGLPSPPKSPAKPADAPADVPDPKAADSPATAPPSKAPLATPPVTPSRFLVTSKAAAPSVEPPPPARLPAPSPFGRSPPIEPPSTPVLHAAERPLVTPLKPTMFHEAERQPASEPPRPRHARTPAQIADADARAASKRAAQLEQQAAAAEAAKRSEQARVARAHRIKSEHEALEAAQAVAEEEARVAAGSALKAAKETFGKANPFMAPVAPLQLPVKESRASRMARRRQLSQRWREQKRADATPRTGRKEDELPSAFANLP